MKKLLSFALFLSLMLTLTQLSGCLLPIKSTTSSNATNSTANKNSTTTETNNKNTAPIPSTESATETIVNSGTRQDPFKMNEKVIYKGMNEDRVSYQFNAEITMLETIRGKEAAKLIKEINDYNDDAPTGKEYILVKFKVKILESKDDEKVTFYKHSFRFINNSGVEYDTSTYLSLREYGFKDLYAGGDMECFAYELIEIGDKPLIHLNMASSREGWFDPNS